MPKSLKIVIGAVVLGVAVGAATWYLNRPRQEEPGKPGKYDVFAQCLADKGSKMYGAYWCSHCQNQKKEFGSSFKYVTYVECALRGAQGQAKACDDASVKGYPTWTFADGTRNEGEITLESLAAKTGCTLPGSSEAPLPPAPSVSATGTPSTMPALSASPAVSK